MKYQRQSITANLPASPSRSATGNTIPETRPKGTLTGWLGFLLLPVFILSGCESTVLGDEPGTGNGELFDLVWEDVDRNYTYFDLKGVDWDSIRAADRPRALAAETEDELFYVLADMLDDLHDGHVNLYGDGDHTYDYNAWYEDYPENYDPGARGTYLHELDLTPIYFGCARDSHIAYVHIPTFAGNTDPAGMLAELIEEYGPFRGLIIDVRSNGGGSDRNSRALAGLFAENAYTFAHVRFKRGPAHDDFTPWESKRITPSAGENYNIPVALLTNRKCFSACEDFTLAMRQQPDVTVIGDTTGGGAGNPASRELPNGWSYRFSTWQQVTAGMEHYEGRGLYPDIPIWITEEQGDRRKDPILERAIRELRARIGPGSPSTGPADRPPFLCPANPFGLRP